MGGHLRGEGRRRAGLSDGDEVGAVSHFEEEGRKRVAEPFDSPADVCS